MIFKGHCTLKGQSAKDEFGRHTLARLSQTPGLHKMFRAGGLGLSFLRKNSRAQDHQVVACISNPLKKNCHFDSKWGLR